VTTTLDPRVRYPALHDPNWLRRLYVDEGIPQGGIAKLAGGCSDVTVSHALKRHGIRRPPGWKPPPVELPRAHSTPSASSRGSSNGSARLRISTSRFRRLNSSGGSRRG